MRNPPFVSCTLVCRGEVNNVEGLVGNVRQQINQPHPGRYCPVWILAVIFVMAEALFVDVLRGSFRPETEALRFSFIFLAGAIDHAEVVAPHYTSILDESGSTHGSGLIYFEDGRKIGANDECIKRL